MIFALFTAFLFQTATVVLPALTVGLDLHGARGRGRPDLCPFTEAQIAQAVEKTKTSPTT